MRNVILGVALGLASSALLAQRGTEPIPDAVSAPERFANEAGGARAAWLVFPRYEAGTGTRLGELTRAEALRRLLKTCTLATPLTRQQVETFIVWLRSVECLELPMSSLDAATDLLRDLWRGR